MIKLISYILSKLFPYSEIDECVYISNWDRFCTKAQEDFWGGSPGRTMDVSKLKTGV